MASSNDKVTSPIKNNNNNNNNGTVTRASSTKDVRQQDAECGNQNGNDADNDRGNWGNKWEFLLSCVGLSVGIGNVWRFPYLAYSNGGGAFLIPYLIMLVLVGKPMYYMELAFGQFAGLGPVTIWRCAPLAKGIGAAMIMVTFIVGIYYNVLMSYTIFYIASSFQSEVPWARCDLPWADTATCFVRGNDNAFNPLLNGTRISSSQQYWERHVLGITDGIEDLGTIKWDLALCLAVSWSIVAACLFKGIKTSGKVIYFAATFPYVILLILLIRGLMLDGAMIGILYFITPVWEKLVDIKVWKAAAGQMFFSLSVSMGGLIMYSSYNKFQNNVHRDALVVSVLDTVTSLISGLVIFSILGAMAHDLNVPIQDVVKDGPGLAFVAYPEALARLPIPQLWSILFFIMLFILGLDSEFAMIETISTCISDEYPQLRKHKAKVCIGLAIVCYLLGLPCVMNGGQYVLTLMDEYGSGTSLIFIAICECIAIAWIYGISRFCDDIEFMLGHRPSLYWRLTWTISSPLVLAFIFIYAIADYKPLKYGRDYSYPDWGNAIGWLLFLIPVIQIPIWAAIFIFKENASTFKEKLAIASRPRSTWGPSDKTLMDDYQEYIREKNESAGDVSIDRHHDKNTRNGVDNAGAEFSVELKGFNKSTIKSSLTYGDADIQNQNASTFNKGIDNPSFNDNMA